MKRTLLILFCFVSLFTYSQQTISGIFSPADEYSWLIAYRLTPDSQDYVADTKIDKGQFSLTIPNKALPGLYRMVYAVPQDEFYFDIIYNGKEAVTLNFNTNSGVLFTKSKENILFNTYFKELAEAEQKIINFYSKGDKNTIAFINLNKDLLNIQKTYETKTNGMLVNNFIKANHPYVSSAYEKPEQYVKNKKELYFKHLNLTDSLLQSSQFLKDKLVNYVFTALPLKTLSDLEKEKEIQANLHTLSNKIKNLPEDYQFTLYHLIWKNASSLKLNNIADYVLTKYLKLKAKSEESKNILTQIEAENRLRIGAKAAEIEWQSKGKIKKLSTLEDATNYILIFWSSTCSHCLRELPTLNKELKKYPKVKVLAVGLEDDEITWKIESEKLDNFEHAIALGKWESKYAKLYDIHQTPTYFILDQQKRIVAKPESDKDVIAFLRY